jgi:hypothetical protein
MSKIQARLSGIYLDRIGDDDAAIKANINVVAAIADHTDPTTTCTRVDSRGQPHSGVFLPSPRDDMQRKWAARSWFDHNHLVVWFVVEENFRMAIYCFR